MSCNEQVPYPDLDLTADCRLELGHPGAHESYRGDRFPRPVPSGTATEALALIDEAAGDRRRWDLNEREFLVKVSVTNVYLVKVSAETEDDAIINCPDLSDIDLRNESPIDGSYDVERPDQYERSMTTGAPIGPKIACPDCGQLSMNRTWYHSPLRKCHGPIEWVETRSPSPRYRWRRKFPDGPSLPAATSDMAAVS
ncbi:hypothetical protein [Streptomyces sp. NPDC015131]|uniref:hypothetical protein n=1 Tax=Streptomyces sp. NPDC015131 TaxID=3364941 RepID=UPI0036FCDBA8